MYGLKLFLFTSCRHVYDAYVMIFSTFQHLQLKKMSVIYQSAHVAITFQLLEMSSMPKLHK